MQFKNKEIGDTPCASLTNANDTQIIRMFISNQAVSIKLPLFGMHFLRLFSLFLSGSLSSSSTFLKTRFFLTGSCTLATLLNGSPYYRRIILWLWHVSSFWIASELRHQRRSQEWCTMKVRNIEGQQLISSGNRVNANGWKGISPPGMDGCSTIRGWSKQSVINIFVTRIQFLLSIAHNSQTHTNGKWKKGEN